MQVFKFSLGVIFGDISGGTSQKDISGNISGGHLREHLGRDISGGTSQGASQKRHLRGDISGGHLRGKGISQGDISWDISGGVSFVDSEFTQSNFCQTRQRRSLTSHNL